MDISALLTELMETPGPSGAEERIAALIEARWQPLTDGITYDRSGTLLGVKYGSGEPAGAGRRPRILLAGHMDEIGLMVSEIVAHPDKAGQGFLRVAPLGGVDRRHIYAQQVVVHGKQELPGIIGALPGRMLPEERASKPYEFGDLCVDTGLSYEALNEQVHIGDFITFYQPARKLLNGWLTGKAIDNRAAVAAITVCLEYLQSRDHAWDVIAAATTQEETRLLGAFTSSFVTRPDAAIAIDVTFGKGPGAKDHQTFELGSGPTLAIGPNVHPGLHKGLKAAASELEMSVSLETHTRNSGTDAAGLQLARAGVPTAVVGIPLRYMHTMVETVAIKDIKRVGTLLGEFICGLTLDFTDQMAAALMETE
ncbi:MAG: M42 family peptidase [Ardenticatenales bacterium]|nr:M42 family peptidase [Ardenticatenales bacterium]